MKVNNPEGSTGPSAFQNDAFTATTGAQTLTLTYTPIVPSIHVYLDGLEQRLNTDWTVAGNVVSVLSTMGAVAGDRIDVLYAYTTGMTPPEIDSPYPPPHWLVGMGTEDAGLPAGSTAGDLAILFVAIPTDRTITTHGWTVQGNTATSHTSTNYPGGLTYDLYTLSKVITSSTDVPTFSADVSQKGIQWIVAVHHGGHGAAVTEAHMDAAPSGTSLAAPACTGGAANITIRGWMTVSGAAWDGTPPTNVFDPGFEDVNLGALITADLSAQVARCLADSGWAASSVGVDAS